MNKVLATPRWMLPINLSNLIFVLLKERLRLTEQMTYTGTRFISRVELDVGAVDAREGAVAI